MDTEYLKKNLGKVLVRCCAEVVEKRPQDPIEYISQYLYKYIENEKESKKELYDQLELNRLLQELHAKEEIMKVLVNEELALVEQENKLNSANSSREKISSATE